MITIFLDSSNRDMSVGIADDNKLIEVVSYEAWQSQSEVMVPELDKLLTKYNVSRGDIKDIFVANGPGSYTGVRIAVTIAKTISTCLNVDIYPVSSLQILKDGDKPSICLINARSKRSYVGVYQNEKCLLEDQIMTNEDVLGYIARHPDYSICGDTAYLGIEGIRSNVIEQMFSLRKALKPVQNPLGLTPVYMKD